MDDQNQVFPPSSQAPSIREDNEVVTVIVPHITHGGAPWVHKDVEIYPEPIHTSAGDPTYEEPEQSVPEKHPLEDFPYLFSKSPGIGYMGGDGPGASSEAWLACTRAVREYDDKLIQSWRSEMNTTLVFVCLFLVCS